MFWQLLLAHLLADFPLQPRWLVEAKQRLGGLVLHASIHLLTMLLLVGEARWALLRPLISLALVHFLIDLGKYRLAVSRPGWVTLPYLVDQAVHVLTLLGAARWIGVLVDPPAAQPWMIYAIGYLGVTHVWFVTERMLTWPDKRYQRVLDQGLWPRMVARALMLTTLLLLGLGPAMIGMAWLPYRRTDQGGRALLTDLAVAAAVALLLRWAARAALGG